ncbi:DUF805 domain-containing protein [Lacticaseibacillus sp. GG6-2]
MIDEQMGHVSFGRALKDYLRGYVDFRGRSTRAGYWWVQLILFLIWLALLIWLTAVIIMSFTVGIAGNGFTRLGIPAIIAVVFFLATILPSLALKVRRYRDAGLRGRGTAVILILQYAIATTTGIEQYQQMSYVFAHMERAAQTAMMPNGFSLFLSFTSTALGLFLFVLTLLPSNTMVTSSKNGFVRFFIREKVVPPADAGDVA